MVCIFSPHHLHYPVLLYGVFIGTITIFDMIVDGLILRTVKGSDAYACWDEIMPCCCCLPRCVGVQWVLVAIFFQFFGLWWDLVLLSEECEDQSWGQCFHINLPEWELYFDHLDFWDGWDIGR
jgi:hypothetical protein